MCLGLLEGFSFNRMGEKYSNATDLQPVVAIANHQAANKKEHLS